MFDIEEARQKMERCGTCGYPVNAPRKPIFIKRNIAQYSQYLANKCSECGHQKDGETIIKEVYKMGNRW